MLKNNLEKFKTPLKIGSFEMPSRILPAPMAGVSDRCFRDLLRHYGCKLTYTEMVSSEGLTRGKNKTQEHMEIEAEPKPFAVQIYGANPERLAEAARMVETYEASLIDLNVGCPARKITKNKCGSALMNDMKNLREIISQIRRATKAPFTVKTRSGFGGNSKAFLEVARIAEEEGADAICLHPRTREQMYSGHSNWEHIAEMKSLVKIPVIGNGDINSVDDAVEMINQTNCDAVMIGRAAMGNPWIFMDCVNVIEKGEEITSIRQITLPEKIEAVRFHYNLILSQKQEIGAIREMRKYVIKYFKGFPGARELRNKWMQTESYEEIQEILNQISENTLNL